MHGNTAVLNTSSFFKQLLSITSVIALLSAANTLALAVEPRSGTPLTQAQAEARLIPNGITASSTGGCTDR